MLVFPLIWGLTEQITYNGYLVPRFQVLGRSTSLAIVLVAFAWSLQHSFMPLTFFDVKFMVFRFLLSVYGLPDAFISASSPIGSFAIAHALLDGASVLIGVRLPVVKA